VPFVAAMFFINYLDRTAIGFAGPNGMNEDLGLTAAQFGFASGVFFIAYILLEVPSNIALSKFGARKWLTRIMITWGIVAVLFTWTQNFEQLAILRFLLGVMEAGFFPGAIFFLSSWVPARHRGRILALFYLAQPLTTVIGAPLAGLLIQQHGLFGLEGWRIMYLGVGLPAIVLGILAWFVLVDRPSKAKWLSVDEASWLENELEAEQKITAGEKPDAHRVGAAFKLPRVWALGVGYFGLVYGFYALAFFLPTIIAGFQEESGRSFTVLDNGLITAIPYLPAAVALYLWSRDATRRGVRAWHVWLPALIGAVTIPFALFAGSPFATVAVITITAMSIFAAFPVFWSLPTHYLSGPAAAAGVALIGAIGNLAGFVAPYITGALRDALGDYTVAMGVVGLMMLISAVIIFTLNLRGGITKLETGTIRTTREPRAATVDAPAAPETAL
jgi:MFS family permease